MLSSFKEMARSLCIKYPSVRRYVCRTEPLVYIDALGGAKITNESVVVLSVNDYWVLRAELNVKSEKEAAAYGAALFDLGDEYRYEAQQAGKNSYILIAYNPSELYGKFTSLSDMAMVKKMTFAQWVFGDIDRPISLPNGKYLTAIDGIVIEMDSTYIDKSKAVELDTVLHAPRIFLKTVQIVGLESSEVTPKTLRNTLIVLVMLLGNFGAIAVLNYQESLRLNEKIDTLLSTSKLPETSFERDALLDSLKNKEKKQLRIRRLCKEISDLPIEGKSPTPLALPSLPPVLSPSTDGIVLIPGSKPGEPNRLLVDNNTTSAPVVTFHGEGIRELNYDGNAISFILDVSDASIRGSLKTMIMSRFKDAQEVEHENQLEVRLK